jgi:hypothetical protein
VRPRQIAQEITTGWTWVAADAPVEGKAVLVRAVRAVLSCSQTDFDALAARVKVILTVPESTPPPRPRFVRGIADRRQGRRPGRVATKAVVLYEALADFRPTSVRPAHRELTLAVPFVVPPGWPVTTELHPEAGCPATFEREEAPVSTEFVMRWYASIVGRAKIDEDALAERLGLP